MALLMNWEAELIKNVQGSLNTVDSETTNQKKYLDKDKTESLTRTKHQFHAAVTLVTRFNDAAHTMLSIQISPLIWPDFFLRST